MHPIRPMTADDVPLIARWLVQVPLWQRYRLDEAAVYRLLGAALQAKHILPVADAPDSDPACGFAWVVPRGAFERSAYLRLIGVRPDRAEVGIGAALLGEAERQAAAISRDLFLLVSDFNTDAQRFYQRHGYRQVGAIPAYVLPDVAELIYHKVLREDHARPG